MVYRVTPYIGCERGPTVVPPANSTTTREAITFSRKPNSVLIQQFDHAYSAARWNYELWHSQRFGHKNGTALSRLVAFTAQRHKDVVVMVQFGVPYPGKVPPSFPPARQYIIQVEYSFCVSWRGPMYGLFSPARGPSHQSRS
jgi:hypothetical protein